MQSHLDDDARLTSLLERFVSSDGLLVVLSGAGISAESGIPTFRGQEGYWTIGSRNYTPMEIATREMFEREPEAVWAWYLMRFERAKGAEPNPGHLAVAELERALGDRLAVITQNIDGLHERGGVSSARTFAIHGDARKMRCSSAAHDEERALTLLDLPTLGAPEPPLPADVQRQLTCARCGAWMRPHVLWFDEYYTEALYRSDSALEAAQRAALLIVVGTTGSTTLPVRIGLECAQRGVPIIDINLEDNPFSSLARARDRGLVLRERASVALPRVARALASVTT